MRSANRRASAPTGEWSFPPKAPPFPKADAGAPRGSTTKHRARRRPAPPRWSEGQIPRHPAVRPPGGRAAGWCAALDLAGRGPGRGSDSATTYSPEPSGTATRASAGQASSANPARPSTTRVRPAGGPRPRGRPGRGPSRSRAVRPPAARIGRAGEHQLSRLYDGLPPGAPAQVGEQGLVDLFGRRRAGADGARAASLITMPGVQNPHWLPPVATSAAHHRSLSGAGRPSRVVIWRPWRRRTGVTHATRGDRRPRPCSSHTAPAGCSRPLRSGRPVGRAGHRAATIRRPPPRRRRHRRGAGSGVQRLS